MGKKTRQAKPQQQQQGAAATNRSKGQHAHKCSTAATIAVAAAAAAAKHCSGNSNSSSSSKSLRTERQTLEEKGSRGWRSRRSVTPHLCRSHSPALKLYQCSRSGRRICEEADKETSCAAESHFGSYVDVTAAAAGRPAECSTYIEDADTCSCSRGASLLREGAAGKLNLMTSSTGWRRLRYFRAVE